MNFGSLNMPSFFSFGKSFINDMISVSVCAKDVNNGMMFSLVSWHKQWTSYTLCWSDQRQNADKYGINAEKKRIKRIKRNEWSHSHVRTQKKTMIQTIPPRRLYQKKEYREKTNTFPSCSHSHSQVLIFFPDWKNKHRERETKPKNGNKMNSNTYTQWKRLHKPSQSKNKVGITFFSPYHCSSGDCKYVAIEWSERYSEIPLHCRLTGTNTIITLKERFRYRKCI